MFFGLNSDDGSKFWIEKQLIIDNDSIHRMQLIQDTIWLERGIYKTQLWYYNALPEEYGLIFDYNYLKDFKECDKSIATIITQEPLTSNSKAFSLSESFYFETGSHILSNKMKSDLDNIGEQLESLYVKDLLITGYTDVIGSTESNLILSQKRAQSVFDYLNQNFNLTPEKISVLGAGEVNSTSETSKNHSLSKNRNVTIEFTQ